ncbi:tetratricopeptide repeat protein [Nocardia takedensis]|uniref:tetratricopeptide repeat protein n=1 Tax=Nocardia takedensis TaxID=259390 RepID=UPI0005942451|nr:tetratricopeptide repeat protein [Nocardia takedensis]
MSGKPACHATGLAVDVYRELARTEPTTTYHPKLTHALDTLATRLAFAGHLQDALAPAREAVELYRELARTDPTAHHPQLAHALRTLAIRSGQAGYLREAVAPARESVDLHRELVESASSTSRFFLAQSLWLLSAVAVETGNLADLRLGVAAAVEAVEMLEQLVEELPGAYDRTLQQARRSKARAYEQLTTAPSVDSDTLGGPQDA